MGTITHSKVSNIPDCPDDALINPSDWNASHALTGFSEEEILFINGGVISGSANFKYDEDSSPNELKVNADIKLIAGRKIIFDAV